MDEVVAPETDRWEKSYSNSVFEINNVLVRATAVVLILEPLNVLKPVASGDLREEISRLSSCQAAPCFIFCRHRVSSRLEPNFEAFQDVSVPFSAYSLLPYWNPQNPDV